MKYFPLVWSGVWRKPVRTTLTFLSIVVAFILFGILTGLATEFAQAVAKTRTDVVVVYPEIEGPSASSMPVAYHTQIEGIPGVLHALTWGIIDLTYQQPTNHLPAWPVDPADLHLVYPEIQIPPDQLDALSKTRTGAIVPVQLVSKYGWKIGDKIPFQSRVAKEDGTSDWTFDIVGIYDAPLSIGINMGIITNFTYVDTARASDKGTAFEYDVVVRDPARAAQVSKAIDTTFVNSAVPTRTRPLSIFTEGVRLTFDIQFFAEAVVGSGFFMLLLLTANTMTESVRERTPEFAVLKTLGFSRSGLFALILTEALIPCTSGALVGLLAAKEAIKLVSNHFVMFQQMAAQVPWSVVIIGLGLSVAVAFVSSLIPALRVTHLNISNALAKR